MYIDYHLHTATMIAVVSSLYDRWAGACGAGEHVFLYVCVYIYREIHSGTNMHVYYIILHACAKSLILTYSPTGTTKKA